MKTIFTTILLLISIVSPSQNINCEKNEVAFYSYPLKPLDKSAKTYSTTLPPLGFDVTTNQKENLLGKALVLPGFQKVPVNGDIQIELVLSPFQVTNKEVKDSPSTVEKDGQKTVYHNYTYELSCVFPAKLRIMKSGGLISENDFPAHFKTKFYPTPPASTTDALAQAFNKDMRFLNDLINNRINERVTEIKNFISSNYGYGPVPQGLWLCYLKDKRGEYEDLTKGYNLMKEALEYANNKDVWLDDTFKGKMNEVKAISEKALTESSDDKKARIDMKVTAMIHYNLALVSYTLNELDKSDEWLSKITKKAPSDIEEAASELKEIVNDKRARLFANGLIAGKPAIENNQTPQQLLIKEPVILRDYIVSKPGDTLDIQFIVPSVYELPYGDSVWLQDKIVVFKNGKNVTFYPGEIHGYAYKGVFRESLSWIKDMSTNPWTFEKKFCKRLISGTIPVFKCEEVKNSFRDPSQKIVESTIRYIRPDNQLGEFGLINFNKWVAKLIFKYPELSEKVKNGAYEKSEHNFLAIIKEYNQWAKSQ